MSFQAAISLGSACQVAHQLRVHRVRSAAFPFDWMVTPFQSLCRLLENDFDRFLAPESLRLVRAPDGASHVEETQYGVQLPHDFPATDQFLQRLGDVRDKYARRTRRFRDLLASGASVAFLRQGLGREEAPLLRDLLASLYPRSRTLLVAINDTEEMTQEWQMEGVLNVSHPPRGAGAWTGDDETYDRLFGRLGLSETPADSLHPPELYRATVRCPDCPPRMVAGGRYEVGVEVRNDSPVAWYGPADEPPHVNVTYHWYGQGREPYQWNNERVYLPTRLPPGEAVRLRTALTAPAVPGFYTLQWDLVIEYVAWFSERGCPLPEHAVEVLT